MTQPEERQDTTPTEPSIDDPIITRNELLAGLTLFFGAMLVIGAVLVFLNDTGEDIPGSVAATGTATTAPAGTGATPADGSPLVVPQNADEQAIENLSRLSIILLPTGHWPDLYDDFTPEFQARCTAEEFAAAGEQGAADLGADLELLGFKGLQSVTVTGDTAEAVIVGELRGKSEYRVEAAFERVNGVWKLAPVEASEGCSAFNRLEG